MSSESSLPIITVFLGFEKSALNYYLANTFTSSKLKGFKNGVYRYKWLQPWNGIIVSFDLNLE